MVGQAQSKKAQRMVDSYLEVAFWQTGSGLQPMTRWGKDTVTYRVVGDNPFMNAKTFQYFMDDMARVTGLYFERVERDEDVTIFFGAVSDFNSTYQATIPPQAHAFSNWSGRTFLPNGDLRQARMCIDPNKVVNYNEGEYFIQKLFIKSLGLLGNSEDEFSIFYAYYNENNERVTRADKRLVKLHYHDALKSGLTKQEVRAILASEDLDQLASEKL